MIALLLLSARHDVHKGRKGFLFRVCVILHDERLDRLLERKKLRSERKMATSPIIRPEFTITCLWRLVGDMDQISQLNSLTITIRSFAFFLSKMFAITVQWPTKVQCWINPIRTSTWHRRNAFFWMSIPASAQLALRLVNAYKIRVLGFSLSVLCFEIGFRSTPVSSPQAAGQSMVYWIHFLIVRFVSLLILSPKTDDDGAEHRAGSPSKPTLGPAR